MIYTIAEKLMHTKKTANVNILLIVLKITRVSLENSFLISFHNKVMPNAVIKTDKMINE